MSRPHLLSSFLLGGLLVGGCGTSHVGTVGTPLPSPGVTVTGPILVGAERQLLQTATAWTATSVKLIRVYLKRGPGAEVLLGGLSSTSQPVVIRNLRPNTAYEVRLAAYAEAAGTTAIDSGDVNSVTSFTTGTDTRLEQTFKLRLRDQTYEGAAETNLTLTEGAIEDATGTLELEKS
jgi:hypothetical protein